MVHANAYINVIAAATLPYNSLSMAVWCGSSVSYDIEGLRCDVQDVCCQSCDLHHTCR